MRHGKLENGSALKTLIEHEQLYRRLWKLREVEPSDGAALNLLNYLEKQHSISLTPLQEQLLQTLESYYSG